MDHGLMTGMLVAGIALSAFPIALGVAIAVKAYRYYRDWKAAEGSRRG
jgi:hypothetical protein